MNAEDGSLATVYLFLAPGQYLELFALDERKTPLELSEGMKVKCNLLLSLSHRAEVLILDEPTSGLDPFSRSELLDIFIGLKNEGVAVFFSTHVISDIEKCADDIVYLSGGSVVAATDKADFARRYAEAGETLEDTMLRMEKALSPNSSRIYSFAAESVIPNRTASEISRH